MINDVATYVRLRIFYSQNACTYPWITYIVPEVLTQNSLDLKTQAV